LSALLETAEVELVKFGEACQMVIPSQARTREGVETWRRAPKATAKVKRKSRPQTSFRWQWKL